jgi:hypothetical protein
MRSRSTEFVALVRRNFPVASYRNERAFKPANVPLVTLLMRLLFMYLSHPSEDKLEQAPHERVEKYRCTSFILAWE